MHHPRLLRSLFTTALLSCCATTFAQVAANDANRQAFLDAHPGTGVLQLGDQVARVYGRAFSNGATPDESASRFIAAHAAVFGVSATDLAAYGPFESGEHLVPLMPEDDGSMKFTAVYFTQTANGIPVFRSHLSVLVRNEPGFPAVLAGSTLWNLGDFAQTLKGVDTRSLPSYATLTRRSLNRFAAPPVTTPASYVIWAGVDRVKATPALAVQYEAEGRGIDGAPLRFLFVVDAKSGEILYEENRIYNFVGGQVRGLATQGYAADACAAESAAGLPYAMLSNSTGTYYADANGNYSIPVGTGALTVTLGGKFFTLSNNGAPTNMVYNSTQVDGATYNPTFNPANLNATDRSQVNAYLHANIVRDMVLAASPAFPTVSTQNSSFLITTNIADVCNAYYTASTINFFLAGGGCSNTAFGTVVHHEYGHNVVEKGGSGQGAYGEGMGDIHGLLIADVAETGIGFQSCASPLRTAANNCMYSSSGCSSCGSEIHACGMLISGCVWDMRNHLVGDEPAQYLTTLRRIVVNSIPLHGAISTIAADIPIDFLTLDDDNADIGDGTPHYQSINYGFTLHGIAVPAVQPVVFGYPSGVPTSISPTGSTAVQVSIAPLGATPVASTARLLVRSGGASGFTEVTLAPQGGNLYLGQFPGGTCLDSASYYFSIQTTGGATQTDPANAPASVYSATIAASINTVATDAFEGAVTGWTVGGAGDTATNGLWVVADPAGTGYTNGVICQPEDDATASPGTKCWITGNGAGGTTSAARTAADVDGGTTTLLSPTYDCSGADVVQLRYSRWYAGWQSSTAASTGDSLVVQLSNDNGSTWTTVETVNTNAGAWVARSVRVGDFVTPTAQVRVRFRATDAGSDSTVEAGIDDFSIAVITCTAPVLGDINGDGLVDGTDLGLLLGQWGTAGAADLNHDGIVDGGDLGLLLAHWQP